MPQSPSPPTTYSLPGSPSMNPTPRKTSRSLRTELLYRHHRSSSSRGHLSAPRATPPAVPGPSEDTAQVASTWGIYIFTTITDVILYYVPDT